MNWHVLDTNMISLMLSAKLTKTEEFIICLNVFEKTFLNTENHFHYVKTRRATRSMNENGESLSNEIFHSYKPLIF